MVPAAQLIPAMLRILRVVLVLVGLCHVTFAVVRIAERARAAWRRRRNGPVPPARVVRSAWRAP